MSKIIKTIGIIIGIIGVVVGSLIGIGALLNARSGSDSELDYEETDDGICF